jgi:hypothetical protein
MLDSVGFWVASSKVSVLTQILHLAVETAATQAKPACVGYKILTKASG